MLEHKIYKVSTFPELLEATKVPGKVFISLGSHIVLEGDLRIASGCEITSDDIPRGAKGYDYSKAWLDSLTQLVIPPEYTIHMESGSGLSNLTLVSTEAYGDKWKGCAITIDNPESIWDAKIINMLIIGFEQAVYGNGCPRLIMNNVHYDCLNGVHIENAEDCIDLYNVQGWPYLGVRLGDLNKNGTAFYFGKNTDGCKVINCFSYGYYIGFHLDTVSVVYLTNCGADAVLGKIVKDSIGFYVSGDSNHNHLVNCQSYCHDYGIKVSTDNRSSAVYLANSLVGNNNTNAGITNGRLYSSDNDYFTANLGVQVLGKGKFKDNGSTFIKNKKYFNNFLKNCLQIVKNML